MIFRIGIIGLNGAGKSTYAAKLVDILRAVIVDSPSALLPKVFKYVSIKVSSFATPLYEEVSEELGYDARAVPRQVKESTIRPMLVKTARKARLNNKSHYIKSLLNSCEDESDVLHIEVIDDVYHYNEAYSCNLLIRLPKNPDLLVSTSSYHTEIMSLQHDSVFVNIPLVDIPLNMQEDLLDKLSTLIALDVRNISRYMRALSLKESSYYLYHPSTEMYVNIFDLYFTPLDPTDLEAVASHYSTYYNLYLRRL